MVGRNMHLDIVPPGNPIAISINLNVTHELLLAFVEIPACDPMAAP